MQALRVGKGLIVLIALTIASSASASAQPGSNPPPPTAPQTRLEVLTRQGDYYWVVATDSDGSRRGGWIPAQIIDQINRGNLRPIPPSPPSPLSSISSVIVPNDYDGLVLALREMRSKVGAAAASVEGLPDAATLNERSARIDQAIALLQSLATGEGASGNRLDVPVIAQPIDQRGAETLRSSEQASNPAPGSGRRTDRKGFLIGFSVGGGAIGCAGCDLLGGGAGDFHIGGMLNEKVALMYDGAAVSTADPAVALSVGTFAVQWWVADRVWLKGGAGFGVLIEDCCTESGLALMGGAGVELVQKRKFVLDLQGRVATTKLELRNVNMFMVSLGFNWY